MEQMQKLKPPIGGAERCVYTESLSAFGTKYERMIWTTNPTCTKMKQWNIRCPAIKHDGNKS